MMNVFGPALKKHLKQLIVVPFAPNLGRPGLPQDIGEELVQQNGLRKF